MIADLARTEDARRRAMLRTGHCYACAEPIDACTCPSTLLCADGVRRVTACVLPPDDEGPDRVVTRCHARTDLGEVGEYCEVDDE